MEQRAALDRAPGFMGRQASGIGRRLADAVALAAVVLGIFSGPAEVDGAIIFEADQQASLNLGAQMALADKVRQVQFDIVGGSYAQLHGTAAPLGPWYSAISQHYLDYIVSTSGSSNFSITIATGAGINSRLQTIAITSYQVHPTLDFVILKHSQPVIGAALPVFGTMARLETATFVGFGNDQFFGSATGFNDGLANAYNMRLTNLNAPTNYLFSKSGALGIPGGALLNDSSSPGYNPAGELAFFMETAAVSSLDNFATAGAIPFVASGLDQFIYSNTPLNYASPEPAALVCTVAGGQVELSMSKLVTGRMYRLMRSGTLAAASWTQAHSFTATGPTATWSEAQPPGGRQFYRLEWTE